MGLYPFTAYNIYDLPRLVNIGEWQKSMSLQGPPYNAPLGSPYGGAGGEAD